VRLRVLKFAHHLHVTKVSSIIHVRQLMQALAIARKERSSIIGMSLVGLATGSVSKTIKSTGK
jgi:hypothetical protein